MSSLVTKGDTFDTIVIAGLAFKRSPFDTAFQINVVFSIKDHSSNVLRRASVNRTLKNNINLLY